MEVKWSWPEHPFKYRVRMPIGSQERKNARDWVEKNIKLHECLTFHGPNGDCYFKNEEDAILFKLTWG